MRLRLLTLLLPVALAADGRAPRTVQQQRADLAVRANRMLDVRTGRYEEPVVVLVSGTRITRVVPGGIEGPRVLAAGIWVGSKGGVCEFGGIGIPDGAEGFVQRVRGGERFVLSRGRMAVGPPAT